jgi:hypothetical protein
LLRLRIHIYVYVDPEGKKRWCGGCAKGHVGAVNVAAKMCEGCGLKQPNFGLPVEGKKRWCAGCAKGHTGAEDLMDRRRNIKKR